METPDDGLVPDDDYAKFRETIEHGIGEDDEQDNAREVNFDDPEFSQDA